MKTKKRIMKTKKSIVFIHGLWGFTFGYKYLINYFKKNNIKYHRFDYKENTGQSSIEKIAKKFDAFVKKNIKEPFVIIGLSLGGLVGSYWLEFLNTKKKCDSCIAVCSPFYGSYSAYLSSLKGIKELRPNSSILKKLRKRISKSKIRYYVLWDPVDLIVFPGSNAKLKNAFKSRRIFSILHGFFAWPNPVKEIVDEIMLK